MPRPPGPIVLLPGCTLTWNGIEWAETVNNCSGGLCAVPARDGAYIGEQVQTPCLDLNKDSGKQP
jgi:hypothetical protein